MASTIMDIRGLAQYHAREVCRSPESWTGYLDAAAKFYRYPFYDSFLIHAQRPDATACAAMPEWNQKMHRWVNRGSTGIALIDDHGQKLRLRYVFDIKDTHPVQGAKKIRLWKMDYKKEARLKEHLRDTYGVEENGKETMPQMLMSLAKSLTAENIRQAMYDLNKGRENSYLATMEEVSLLQCFTKLVEESVSYVLMKRCGYHPLEHMDLEEFEMIRMFDDISVLPYLGEAVHTITEPVLMDIGRVVMEIDQADRQKQLEAAPVAGQISFAFDGKEVLYDSQAMDQGTDIQMKPENEAIKQNEQKKQEGTYGRQRKYQIPEVRGLQFPDTDPGRNENKLTGNDPARNKGVDEGPKGKESQQLRNPSSDRGNIVRGSVETALVLPLLPSPEKQQEIITGDAEPNVRTKAKASTKTKEKSETKAKTKQKTEAKTKTTPPDKRISIKTRLKEKRAETYALNRERALQRTITRSKEAVL